MGKQPKPEGRPTKYRESMPDEAEKLCARDGLTDKQLARRLKVCLSTLHNWKNEYPKFKEAVQRGKDAYDSDEVESVLLKRAKGYTFDEITKTRELSPPDPSKKGDTVSNGLIVTKVVRKHVVPDVGAIKLWLLNRTKRWRQVQTLIIEDMPEEITPEQAKKLLEELEDAGNALPSE